MKINKISALWVSLLFICSSMVFTSCDNDDLNTDQYGNSITLNSYGPVPVLRGGVLTFMGSNLDQITEVDLPGADPITNINIVTSGKHSEINIEVPKEKCDTGIVILKTAKGGEIRTLTPITYTENITFDEFYVDQEGNLEGSVGDIITINGDYLNNIHAVIFADGVSVPDSLFTTHTRYKIEATIPVEAKTGRIQLSDENSEGANYLYSDATLTVKLPTATELTPETVKAGSTITVNGTDLNQIATISLEGATVDTMDIVRAENGNSLSFTLPAEATDGEVTLNTYSGVKIVAGSITTVVPSNLSASPSPVKNGSTLTIKGVDLDLVSSITYPNSGEGTIATQSESEITSEVPETAQAGEITLTLANGKTVTVSYTLIEPTVTSISPSTVMAGNQILLRGTDLDLVSAITFPTNQTVNATDFTGHVASAISVVVPAAANGNGLTLVLKNGTSVEISGLTIESSTNPTLSNSPSGNPGAEVVLEGSNYNNVESVYFGSTKVTTFVSRSSTSMTVIIPSDMESGTFDVIMNTTDGNSYTVGTITVVPSEIDLTQGNCVGQSDQSTAMNFPLTLTWDDSGRFRVQRNSPIDLTSYTWTAGVSKLKIYKDAATTGQAQINDGNWSSFTTLSDWSGGVEVLEMELTQDMIDWITGAKTDGWSNTAFIIQGDGMTVQKITLVP
ncbi:MAG: polygalacturonase [Prevotellaceae bacterium]|nr:polygalacturonase [Prevotellaceae bacterium]